MNKPELIDEVAKIAELKKKEAAAAVDAVLETVKKVLKKEGKVQIVGFGSFEVKRRKARMGRNPQTKEPIKIAAAKLPVFRPGKELKDTVAGKKR